MLPYTVRINSQLLFIISFSITALAIYTINFSASGSLLTAHHSYILNVLFINLTFFGSSLFSMGLVVFLFYKKKNALAWLIISSTFIAILFTQVIKNYAAKDGIHIYLEDGQSIIDGGTNAIRLYISAHTALAFALATIFALHFNDRRKTIALFLIAVIVAYSRIYLDRHTIYDIIGGIVAGLGSASIVVYCYFNYLKARKTSLFPKPKFPVINFPPSPFSIE